MEMIGIAETGLVASRIGLGTWSIGGWMWGGADDRESIRTIHAALDGGITLIDTAPVYGFGHAERVVGRALAEDNRRHRVVLATKAGLDWGPDEKPFRNASRGRIVAEVEASLRRLGTDVIDLYQIHWPDRGTPAAETAAAMDALWRAGKIRAVGVSNHAPAEMEAFRAHGPLHAAQPPYNLFERGIEADVLPYCRRTGITTLVYGAVCRGLLAGRITADTRFEGDDLRRADPKFAPDARRRYLAAVHALDAFARDRYGKRVVHLALRWLLDRPGVGIALWGARHPGQLDPLAGIGGWSLDGAAMAEIDAILARHLPVAIGPEFMAPPGG
jgi:aryl-alcohol dehydrogenase-like predicted oxidoreductase